MELQGTETTGTEQGARSIEATTTLRRDRGRRLARALGSGAFGALALTAAHESLRALSPRRGPRMHEVGERGLGRIAHLAGRRAPHGKARYRTALVGDALLNSLYYGLFLIGEPARPYLRGLLGGVLAGVGALTLPPKLGIAPRGFPRRVRPGSTFGVYLLGGLAAAACYARLARPRGA